ncbi:MAG TPA: hypothetical protein VMP01_24420 [Pirellulaceae bacterium]|nr:hypothetical protein [Pirellulaceae bacterium]
MNRCCQILVVFGWAALALLPRSTPAVEAAKERRVYIEVCVAEVSLSKLRALGFDWGAIHRIHEEVDRTTGEVPNLIGFLDALVKDDLAKMVSHPRLATMSGRPASLQVGATIKLDVVPQAPDEQKIQLEYRIELNLSQSNAAKEHSPRQLVLASATDLTPGQTCCVSETRSRRTNERGKIEETATVVLIRADFKPPAEIRTAERLQPPKPVQERRYPEIEIPKRR